jgi:predicted nucleic acid-binding protein
VCRGETPRAVWFEAERLVRRVPRVGSPRHTLDCLIAAVARHFRLATRSGDRRFPRLGGKS